MPYKTRCKTGRSGAKVRAMKSCRIFSQQTHLIHPIGPLPHVSVCFVLFVCIWYSLLRYYTQLKTGQTCAKVRDTKSRRNFSQRTHPIHPIGPKLMFWCVLYHLGAFGVVWLPYETRCKTGRTSAKVRVPKSHWNFSQRTHPIHHIGT